LNGKWGVIDYNGNEIIKTNFDEVGYCTNGLIAVSYGDYKGEEYYGIYGLYNAHGDKICPVIYDSIYVAGNIITAKLNGKYSLMDRKGNDISKIKYDNVEKINYDKLLQKYDSFVFVEKDGKRFVVNENGV